MPFRDAEAKRIYDRSYKRLRRAGACPSPSPSRVPTEFRLKTAADVLALLEEQVRAIRDDQVITTGDRARTVGYLAGIALRAIEARDLAARVEAVVEAVLKGRPRG